MKRIKSKKPTIKRGILNPPVLTKDLKDIYDILIRNNYGFTYGIDQQLITLIAEFKQLDLLILFSKEGNTYVMSTYYNGYKETWNSKSLNGLKEILITWLTNFAMNNLNRCLKLLGIEQKTIVIH